MRRSVWFFLLILGLSLSCSNHKPARVMSSGKMENVLYDYHLALVIGMQSGDSVVVRKREYVEAVFKKYGITQAEFDSSMVWYCRQTSQLYNIYQNVGKRLEKEARILGVQTSAATGYAQLSSEGDTANIWNGRNFYLLTANDANNLMSFSMKADSTFQPEDKFTWHFYSHFIYKQGRRSAIANLTVRYDNDSISNVFQQIFSDGENNITLLTANRPIKRINGFVYLSEKWSESEKILVVMNPTLVRFHKERPKEQLEPKVTPADSVARADSIRVADSLAEQARQKAEHSRPIPVGRQQQLNNPATIRRNSLRKLREVR